MKLRAAQPSALPIRLVVTILAAKIISAIKDQTIPNVS